VSTQEPKDLEEPLAEDFDAEGEGVLVDEDDTVIAVAMKYSLAVIAVLAVVAGLVYWIVTRPEKAAAAQSIETEAPEMVVMPAKAPPLSFTDVT